MRVGPKRTEPTRIVAPNSKNVNSRSLKIWNAEYLIIEIDGKW